MKTEQFIKEKYPIVKKDMSADVLNSFSGQELSDLINEYLEKIAKNKIDNDNRIWFYQTPQQVLSKHIDNLIKLESHTTVYVKKAIENRDSEKIHSTNVDLEFIIQKISHFKRALEAIKKATE